MKSRVVKVHFTRHHLLNKLSTTSFPYICVLRVLHRLSLALSSSLYCFPLLLCRTENSTRVSALFLSFFFSLRHPIHERASSRSSPLSSPVGLTANVKVAWESNFLIRAHLSPFQRHRILSSVQRMSKINNKGNETAEQPGERSFFLSLSLSLLRSRLDFNLYAPALDPHPKSSRA